MEVQVPRLHYVHPNCFEAGKPMEFIACGTDLLRHKFRFLVSFAGRYLLNDFCGVVSRGVIKSYHETEDDLQSSEHQILVIRILNTQPDMFGPAFIEVENEHGISNFIPVLFGSQSVCTEMVRLQGSVGDVFCSDIISQTTDSGCIPHLCKHLASSQTSTSDLLLDIAWFLKEPTLEKNKMLSNSMHIQRFNCLLKHLLQNESLSILEKVLHYFDVSMEADWKELTGTVCGTEVRLFLNYVNDARKLLHQKGQLNGRSELDSEKSNDKGSYGQYGNLKLCAPYPMESVNENREAKMITGRPAVINHASKFCKEDVALLNKDIGHGTDCYPRVASDWQQASWFHIFWRRISSSRLAVPIMVSVVMCCGVCVALLHPHKAGDFAVTVRRCLFGGSGNRG